MKNALAHAPEILRRISRYGCVYLFDFDGVLSPIVADFRAARISRSARKSLRALSEKAPVAVISGRKLSDVKRRVGLSSLSYSGSHGLEWRIDGKYRRARVASPEKRAFQKVWARLTEVARHLGLSIEDKTMSFAVHYRAAPPARRAAFRSEAHRVAAGVRILDHLFAFDVMPDTGATKGTIAKTFLQKLRRHRTEVPLYIGDSLTDEDAFAAFPRGITIRVGKEKRSAARYYLSKRSDVDAFLSMLVRYSKSRGSRHI